MRGIFISYRRDDSEGQAGRLYDDLVRSFGAAQIFMDVAGIDPGMDFRKAIDNKISSCGILLSVMGPRWLDAKDEAGHRRLEDPMDFVRLETIAALKRDIPVIPVLVQDARMPKPDQLPEVLRDLAYRNASVLTHARWDSDTAVFIADLQRLIGAAEGGTSKVASHSEPPRETTAEHIAVKRTHGRTRPVIKVIIILLAIIVVAAVLLRRHH